MKKIILLLIISMFTLGCSISVNLTPTPAPDDGLPATEAPTEAPVETATEVPVPVITDAPVETAVIPEFEGTPYDLSGIQMVLPACMATSVNLTIVPAMPYDIGPAEYYPQHRKLTFQGYPLTAKFFAADDPNRTGGVMVYPVADFVAMNAEINNWVINMQNLLATQPANPEGIPLLPRFNAASMFRAQVEYLNFQNGQGVRYLTEYSQYYAPVNNYDLFYSFQGMTQDGRYWISVILPINTATLQESPESTVIPAGGIAAPPINDPNLDANMQAYYNNMVNLLNATPDGSYVPGLDCLDQFIQSLHVGD